MTIEELARACEAALKTGNRISLTMPKGKKRLPGFPRGELLVENPNTGERTYSYDPVKILWHMHKHGVVQIVLTPPSTTQSPE
jgi:hypothetical protein